MKIQAVRACRFNYSGWVRWIFCCAALVYHIFVLFYWPQIQIQIKSTAKLISQLVGQSISQSAIQSVSWSVGQLVSWSVGQLVRWTVGQLVRWTVNQFVSRSISQIVSRSVSQYCRVSGVSFLFLLCDSQVATHFAMAKIQRIGHDHQAPFWHLLVVHQCSVPVSVKNPAT